MWAVIREMTYRILMRRIYIWSLTRTRQDLVGDLSSMILVCVFLGMLTLNVATRTVELWFERRALQTNLAFIETRMIDAQGQTTLYLKVLHETTDANQFLVLENIRLKNDMAVMAGRNQELVRRNRLLEKDLDLSQKDTKR